MLNVYVNVKLCFNQVADPFRLIIELGYCVV
jgi:hypothetical protein